MKYGRYFFAQIKRIKKLLPEMLLLSAVFFLIVIFAGRSLVEGSDYETGKVKYRIGVVGEEASLIDMGIYLLESFDDSRYLMELKRYDDFDLASKDLQAGEISALCEIPEGFYDAVDSLYNDVSIRYYTASANAGITGVVINEITWIISDYIVCSEAGILSLMDYYSDRGVSSYMKQEAVDRLFMDYMGVLLKRGELVTVKTLGIGNNLSTYGYYFVGLTLFLLSVLSFAGISFFIKKNRTLDKIAYSQSISVPGQIFADFSAFYLCSVVCMAVLSVPVFFMLRSKVIVIPEIFTTETSFLLKLFLQVAVTMLPVCLFELLIFEILEGTVNKIVFSFAIIIGCAYISGYLYPASFFPESVARIGRVLPTGVAMRFLSSALSFKDTDAAAGMLAIYVAGLFVILCFVRKRKMNK